MKSPMSTRNPMIPPMIEYDLFMMFFFLSNYQPLDAPPPEKPPPENPPPLDESLDPPKKPTNEPLSQFWFHVIQNSFTLDIC